MIFRKDVNEGVMVATGALLLAKAGKTQCTCFKMNAVLVEVGVEVVSKNKPSKKVCTNKISSLDLRSMCSN
jgi:ribosomal protein L12E/L44/L45/RPP1/RPP2